MVKIEKSFLKVGIVLILGLLILPVVLADEQTVTNDIIIQLNQTEKNLTIIAGFNTYNFDSSTDISTTVQDKFNITKDIVTNISEYIDEKFSRCEDIWETNTELVTKFIICDKDINESCDPSKNPKCSEQKVLYDNIKKEADSYKKLYDDEHKTWLDTNQSLSECEEEKEDDMYKKSNIHLLIGAIIIGYFVFKGSKYGKEADSKDMGSQKNVEEKGVNYKKLGENFKDG